MKFLYLVWSNLKRKKLRTALTLASIFIAFVLFGALCAVKHALTGGISMAGQNRLVVRHKVSLIQTIPQSYEARIANIPGVSGVSAQTWFGGIYIDPKNFFATFPVDPEKYLNMFPEIVVPPEQKAAWLKTRNGALVGRTTAERFHWKIGDHVPLTSPIWRNPANQGQWDFEIVGFYTTTSKNFDTTAFFFRYDYFEEARTVLKGEVGWYTVRIQNSDQAADIAKKIDNEFANSPYETKAEPEAAMAQGFAAQLGNIGAILIAVLSMVFFTILLVAGNTMAQSVRERTEELGVFKALGFTNELVLAIVLAESCVIAAIGGVIGLAIAWMLTSLNNPLPSVLPLLYLPTSDILIGLGFVFGLGIVAGIIPAIQAMRLQTAVALRRNA